MGLPWSKLRRFLPDWAEEAMTQPAGLIEVEGFVARHFGLRLRAEGGFERPALPQAVFKLASGTRQEAVAEVRAIATSVARIVAGATRTTWSVSDITAQSVRATALASACGRGWVDLPALVEATWDMGVPVIYLPDPPAVGRKPDGLLTFVGGRPAIVLTKRQAQPDWTLYVLAHELGHLAYRHLELVEGAAVIDDKIDDGAATPVALGDTDQQEWEANRFAASVVSGGKTLELGTLVKAEVLAAKAIDYGRKHGISPGHVVLNAVRHGGPTMPANLFALGNKALAIIAQSLRLQSTAEICIAAMRRHVDADLLKDDTIQYLEKLKVF